MTISARMFRFPIPLISLLLTCACAGPSKRVELITAPSGAAVSTPEGEHLGSTPLVLTGDTLYRVVKGKQLMVVLDSPGYLPRQLIFDVHGDDVHTVPLTKCDQNYFTQRLIKDFHKNANDMTRTLLKIQGLIMVRQLDAADREVTDFQKLYPSIAAGYALQGNIEMLRGNPEKARGYLLRASSMDPDDVAVQRALGVQTPSQSSPKSGGKPATKPATKSKGKKK